MRKKLYGTAAHLHEVYTVNGGVNKYVKKFSDNGFCQGVLVTTVLVLCTIKLATIIDEIEHAKPKIHQRRS